MFNHKRRKTWRKHYWPWWRLHCCLAVLAGSTKKTRVAARRTICTSCILRLRFPDTLRVCNKKSASADFFIVAKYFNIVIIHNGFQWELKPRDLNPVCSTRKCRLSKNGDTLCRSWPDWSGLCGYTTGSPKATCIASRRCSKIPTAFFGGLSFPFAIRLGGGFYCLLVVDHHPNLIKKEY